MSSQAFAPGFDAAMAILSHVYFGPLIRKLMQKGVPDILDKAPAHAAEVARLSSLHPLTDAHKAAAARAATQGIA